MKFFIDTANLDQIREAHRLGVLDGVTTNPSLMAKEHICGEEACNRHYVEICRIVGGDVSAEVIATDFEGMVREGEALAALDPHIVVKIPCTAEGIRAVTWFAAKGIRTNCTLVFSVGRPCWPRRPERPTCRRLSGGWTTSRRTGWRSWRISSVSIAPTDSGRRCWPPRSAIRTTSSSVWMPVRMS